MKTLTKEVIAYKYGELEEYAREKARENYLLKERVPEFFSEDLRDELQEQYGLTGLETCFSLSNAQGDGLCLHGRISRSELFDGDKFRKIAFRGIHYKQIQSVYDVLQGIDFKYHSRYCYAETVGIDSCCYSGATGRQVEIADRIVGNIESWYLSFCREWESRGYDYFYKVSDEEMAEAGEEFDCLYTEDGEFIEMDKYGE